MAHHQNVTAVRHTELQDAGRYSIRLEYSVLYAKDLLMLFGTIPGPSEGILPVTTYVVSTFFGTSPLMSPALSLRRGAGAMAVCGPKPPIS